MSSDTTAAAPVLQDRIHLAGAWVAPQQEGWVEVVNPATEEVIGRIAEAGPADGLLAMEAAERAHRESPWQQLSYADRVEVLTRAADALVARQQELAGFYVTDQGGPSMVAGYIPAIADMIFRDVLTHAAALPQEPEERLTPGGRVLVTRQPVGPVVAIIPWNAPLLLAVVKVVPALAAGCPVVLKVDPNAPMFATAFAEAFDGAGLPAGMLSVLVGGRELGETLVAHPANRHVTFTGSTGAGQAVMRSAADQLAGITLELGGKSAGIVLADMDPMEVAPILVGACMAQSGQVCTTHSRLLVPLERAEEYIAVIAGTFAALQVGDPSEPGTVIGPLINAAQRERSEHYIASAVADGARIITGGGRPAGLERGYFIEPTLIADVTPEMAVVREEVFGPVITVMTYTDVDDAIRIANSTEFGLANGVYTRDAELALQVAMRLESGTVSINASGTNLVAPFGGWKKSGIGREGGPEAFEAFLEIKQITFAEFGPLG